MLETRREHIKRLLNSGEEIFFDTLKEELEVTDKILREDIFSVSKSLKREGRRILVFPATCVACDYRFGTKRPKPSRCPNCKSQRIRSASYKLR